VTETAWSSWAEHHLRNNWRSAVQDALSTVPKARWHPNGFVVFRLGEVYGGAFAGSHRVHIWPGEIARRALPGHPTIHSHDWELQSLVLSGEYADVIFETSSEGPAHVVHSVRYGETEGDSIQPTSATVHLIRRERRAIEVRSCHHMDVGVPHETLVPVGETVVTYVMMGPRQADGMMLAAERPFRTTNFRRPLLSTGEQHHVSRTLRGVLGAP